LSPTSLSTSESEDVGIEQLEGTGIPMVVPLVSSDHVEIVVSK
jgi:hypothetical protein